MLPYIRLFGKDVYTYPLIIIIGFALAIAVASFRARRAGLVRQDAFNCGLLTFVGAIVGGKLLYLITMLPKIIEQPSTILLFLMGGFTYYGGFLGALGAALIYLKAYKLPVIKYLDLLAPSVPLAQFIGRLGCFCAGCCYGRETSSAFGVMFNHPACIAPTGIYLVPTQLIEAGGCLLLFAILIILASHKPRDGRICSAYLVGYGILRFVIEFFRADDRGPAFGLSVSQYISIAAVAFGIFLFFTARNKPSKAKKNNPF